MSATNETELSQNTRKSGRRAKSVGESRRLEVMRLRRIKARPDEMAKQLNVNLTTIYADLKIIDKQVKAWLYDQAKDGLVSSYKLSIEVLEERQRRLLVIESDPNVKTIEKILASEKIAEIELALWNMLPYTRALMEKVAVERPLESIQSLGHNARALSTSESTA